MAENKCTRTCDWVCPSGDPTQPDQSCDNECGKTPATHGGMHDCLTTHSCES